MHSPPTSDKATPPQPTAFAQNATHNAQDNPPHSATQHTQEPLQKLAQREAFIAEEISADAAAAFRTFVAEVRRAVDTLQAQQAQLQTQYAQAQQKAIQAVQQYEEAEAAWQQAVQESHKPAPIAALEVCDAARGALLMLFGEVLLQEMGWYDLWPTESGQLAARIETGLQRLLVLLQNRHPSAQPQPMFTKIPFNPERWMRPLVNLVGQLQKSTRPLGQIQRERDVYMHTKDIAINAVHEIQQQLEKSQQKNARLANGIAQL